MYTMEQHRASFGFVQRRYAWTNQKNPDHLVVDELLPDGSFSRELLVKVGSGLCGGEFIQVEHLSKHAPDNDHELVVLHTPKHDFTGEVLAVQDGRHIDEGVIEGLAGLLTPRVELTPGED